MVRVRNVYVSQIGDFYFRGPGSLERLGYERTPQGRGRQLLPGPGGGGLQAAGRAHIAFHGHQVHEQRDPRSDRVSDNDLLKAVIGTTGQW